RRRDKRRGRRHSARSEYLPPPASSVTSRYAGSKRARRPSVVARSARPLAAPESRVRGGATPKAGRAEIGPGSPTTREAGVPRSRGCLRLPALRVVGNTALHAGCFTWHRVTLFALRNAVPRVTFRVPRVVAHDRRAPADVLSHPAGM